MLSNEIKIEDHTVEEHDDKAQLVVKTQSYLVMWNEVKQFMKDNIELSDEREYDVLTAWTVSSYFVNLWVIYPYLFFRGTYKTGKTRAQDILILLCPNSESAVNMSIAVLFRTLGEIEDNARIYKTLFIDELSLSGKIDDDFRRIMVQILNAGYKRGAIVKRCLNMDGNQEIIDFRVDGYKCLASIYPLPDTLRSRCITIRMRKTRRRFSMRYDEEKAKNLQYKLFQFRGKILEGKKENPDLFEIKDSLEEYLFESAGRDGRLTEIFAPLFVVAPEEVKPILIDYLRDLGEVELQNELASWEAEIFLAILKVYKATEGLQKNWFSSKAVKDAFNEERTQREQVKTRTISNQIKTFGFKPYRTKEARGYKWNTKLIAKLLERYPIELNDVDDAKDAPVKGMTLDEYEEGIPSPRASETSPSSLLIEKVKKECEEKGIEATFHEGEKNE